MKLKKFCWLKNKVDWRSEVREDCTERDVMSREAAQEYSPRRKPWVEKTE